MTVSLMSYDTKFIYIKLWTELEPNEQTQLQEWQRKHIPFNFISEFPRGKKIITKSSIS